MARCWKTKKGFKRYKWPRKKRKGHRRKGILWEYDYDGMWPYEVINSYWKRYWRQYWRRKGKEDLNERKKDYGC